MTEYQRILTWRLDNDGGGHAMLREHTPDGSIRRKFVFDALDSPKLPRDLAEAIRKDGRTSGKLTLAP